MTYVRTCVLHAHTCTSNNPVALIDAFLAGGAEKQSSYGGHPLTGTGKLFDYSRPLDIVPFIRRCSLPVAAKVVAS